MRDNDEFQQLRDTLINRMVDPHRIKAIEKTRNLFYEDLADNIQTCTELKLRLSVTNDYLDTIFTKNDMFFIQSSFKQM